MSGSVGRTLCAVLIAAGPACAPDADGPFITLASTTSTRDSGLLADLLPRFTSETGVAVRVIAVGSGQAFRLAENGDADVLLVHDRPAEERFVEAGHALARHDVMYNDFVLVGPRDDPAGVRASRTGSGSLTGGAVEALRRIADARAPFASRGDDSGTHRAELRLWGLGEIDPRTASGSWYRETGSGMGATLNTAAGMGAYALADRATWLAFRNRGALEIVLEGDPRLANPYSVLLVSPERHPHIKLVEAKRFADWLTGPSGQAAIAAFRREGARLFFPNPPTARRAEAR